MRSTPRLMPSLQEQPLWSTSQLVGDSGMTQQNVVFFSGSKDLIYCAMK